MDRISGTLQVIGQLSGVLSSVGSISGALSVPERIVPESFSGPYEYTPTDAEQIVEITGLLATDNITIKPIPSNYGLITWDGSVITVS